MQVKDSCLSNDLEVLANESSFVLLHICSSGGRCVEAMEVHAIEASGELQELFVGPWGVQSNPYVFDDADVRVQLISICKKAVQPHGRS